MKKVFLDTNILIDVLEKREPFVTESANVVALGIYGIAQLQTSVLSLANCFYVTRRTLGKADALVAIRTLRHYINISPMGENEFDLAFANEVSDNEDLLQFYSAITAGCEILVTRNEKHFPKDGPIAVMSPEAFLKSL